MKKRIFLILMCSALVFAVGCSNSKEANTPGNNASESDMNGDESGGSGESGDNADSESNSDTSANNEGSTNADHNTTDTSAAGELYSVIQLRKHFQDLDEDGTVLLYSDYDTIQISGDAYPALAAKVEEWQDEQTAELSQSRLDYMEIAKEDRASMEEFYGYSISQDYDIKRLDSHVLSLTESYYEYTGGVHPSYYVDGCSFNAATGEPLALVDVTEDYAAFTEAAIKYILEDLKNKEYGEDSYFDGYEDMVRENFDQTPWYFSAAGITMIYNPYDIAPYAFGMIEVTLPFDSFDSYIREEYQPKAEEGLVAIPVEESASLDIDTGKGSYTLIITNGYELGNDGVYESIPPVLTLNDSTVTPDHLFLRIMNCYLIRQADRTLLMMDGNMFTDDYVTALYDITDGTLRELSSIGASIHTPGINTAELSVRIDVLGTYSSTVSYDISAGQEFQMLDPSYEIDAPFNILTTVKELPVTTEEGEEIMLPAGTSLLPATTDTESYVELTDVATSEHYTLHFNREDYIIMIDGIEEYEYFEMLPYAG